jgi:hypothetical protein
VSTKSIEKTAFLGVAWPRGTKLSPAGTAGDTVGQNWAKPLPNEAVWLQGEFKSESQNGNSG